MLTSSSPWINYTSTIKNDINSDGLIIHSVSTTTVLESIFVSNQSNGPIKVSLKILRDDSEGNATEYYFIRNLSLSEYQGISVYNSDSDGPVYLLDGDVLYGESDGKTNYFTCLISCDELTEI